MANWCSNIVIFSGDNVDKVDELFTKLMEEQAASNLGVRPDWEACEKYDALYMFHIDKRDTGDYQFETKWSPAINTIFLIGRRLKIGFEMTWDECGMGLYGKIVFDPSMPDVAMISDASGINFRFDDDKGMYIYNGEEYQSEYDFIDDVVDTMTASPISKDQILQS
jgi:hypothetical protein